jgi:hypothetical protein
VSRRLLVVLAALGMLATGGGVAAGLFMARDPGQPAAEAGPTTIPETTAPVTSEPASSASSTSSTDTSSTTSTTSGLSVQARVVERAEDGVVVGYEASEPVSAALRWGFGGLGGNQLRFPGPATQGTLKLVLTATVRPVSMQVTASSADGRSGESDILTARRLARRVVLEVRDLTLDIPSGTGGITTGFRGTTLRPLGPGLAGPTAAAEPFAFPSSVLGAGTGSGPLTLRFFHDVRTRVVTLTVPFPRQGQVTLERNVSAIGLTAHLRLRVTVTAS